LAYRVEFTPRAVREFKTLDKGLQNRLARRIDALAANPRPQGIKKLSGEDDLYRLRVGDYRVLYQIQEQKLIVLVVGLGHRSEIYRGLRR
jgi:mRNA interferase RelE/StbE